jgi:hypothetical protein
MLTSKLCSQLFLNSILTTKLTQNQDSTSDSPHSGPAVSQNELLNQSFNPKLQFHFENIFTTVQTAVFKKDTVQNRLNCENGEGDDCNII